MSQDYQSKFDQVYNEVIIGNHFFEKPEYYHEQKIRYRRTIDHIASLNLPPGSKVLDIGGGQIALLCNRLFGHVGVLADVNDKYADAVTKYGMRFITCDLLHDDISDRDEFDLVVLCEIIEHFTIPPYIILEKMRMWIKPGGYLLLTTPNLYRLRNLIRLALGKPLFCPFFYPAKGQPIGHPLEYSEKNFRYQIERAGFTVKYIKLQQLVNAGATLGAKIARAICAPLLAIRPLWRDNMIGMCQKPRA